VAVLDAGMHLPSQQVDPSQPAQCAMPLVLVVARERRVRSGLRRQIGRGVANRLDAGLTTEPGTNELRAAAKSYVSGLTPALWCPDTFMHLTRRQKVAP
jgi:hypothetical protein